MSNPEDGNRRRFAQRMAEMLVTQLLVRLAETLLRPDQWHW